MTVYILTLCLLFYFTISSILSHRKRYSEIVFIVSLTILALLSAFRSDNVGTDTFRYEQYFHWMKTGNYYCPMEFGYCSLTNSIAQTNFSFQIILIIEALVLYLFFYFFVKEFVGYEYWPFSVLLFYICPSFFVSMNTSRQHFALGFILFAFPLWKKRKYIPSLFFFTIAFCIHYAAIICLIFIIFPKKMKRNTYLIYIGVYLLSICIRFLGADKLLTFLLNIIPKYSHYIGSNQFLVSDSLMHILPQILIPNILFVIINIFNCKRYDFKGLCNEGVSSQLAWCSLLYICLLNMFSGSMALSRFSDYFIIPFICFLLCFLKDFSSLNKIESFSLMILIIVAYTFLMCVYIFILGNNEVVPYEFTSFS